MAIDLTDPIFTDETKAREWLEARIPGRMVRCALTAALSRAQR